jgi:hypothetical protein
MVIRIGAAGPPWVIQYLRQPWNCFDAFMVASGYTQFIPVEDSNSSAVRALRALRALRPLRTISRFDALRGVITCLMEVQSMTAGPPLALTLTFFVTLCAFDA